MDVAVIADIVGSRTLPDRAAAQRALDEAILRVEHDRPLATRPLQPVLGDELQGTYPDASAAMASLLLLRLALPDGIDCRYGIGVGQMTTVPSRVGDLAEGPAWWAAREAIELVHDKQSRAVPAARTWIVAAEGHGGVEVGYANAYLLARDQLIGRMPARTRRLAYGRLLGRTQGELADDEQISQSAVSQALASAGFSALAEGLAQLGGRS
ncbi:MAG: hypothetical protein ABS62_12280 [Microbacterium sp. SCN 70-200]|uniref:SatD family protein n=1 Tax=unclassified Microbacterium TaxID=2609290 RepID=UPI00086C05D6|nr:MULTISPECIES: SatD family protein [unclassified Microbacterium]MBN9214097.1 hypothetical protein [Microbacterium sp.]ODT39709.1 MAG: hypothetical protein ABS62_12280 [Microbacterium sp. SCN 70-200]OJV82786.1 MAG: hypothetical protein BGO46_00620 [Microbacterium sp. 70-16]